MLSFIRSILVFDEYLKHWYLVATWCWFIEGAICIWYNLHKVEVVWIIEALHYECALCLDKEKLEKLKLL
jgi:hypothetical protein